MFPGRQYSIAHLRYDVQGSLVAERLPREGKAVFEEIKAWQKQAVREIKFQQQDGLDAEFEALTMGNKTHAVFRAQFGAKLCAMELAGISIARDPEHLHRKYLNKLTEDLRSTVLSHTWLLDGIDKPARKPSSWEKVAQAVELEFGNQDGLQGR